MIFSKKIRYRFGDIDDAGIAYYPSFFHYFHCHFEDWWSDAFGIKYAEVLHDRNFGLPAVRIETDFYRPIRYGDEPRIHLAVLDIGNRSVELGFWMTDEEDRLLCRARIRTVAADMRTKNKRDLPPEWREAFRRFLIPEESFPDGRKE